MITIAIPVGPNPVYSLYIQECIDSLKDQSVPFSEVLFIDDMAGIKDWELDFGNLPVRIYENPWLCGCAHSFNFGVSLAENDLVMLMGSDDIAKKWLYEDLIRAWEKHRDIRGYYHCDVEYDNGEKQSCACNAAMVHKELWKQTGGFPIESSVGAPDTMLISILMAYGEAAGNMYRVESDEPPVLYRRHSESVSSKSTPLYRPIFDIRNHLTGSWVSPEWGRY